jgi:hypothetical protein
MELMKKNNQWGEEEIATHEAEMLAVLTSAGGSDCSCFCFGWKLLSREFLLWLIRQRLPKACNDVSGKRRNRHSRSGNAGSVNQCWW